MHKLWPLLSGMRSGPTSRVGSSAAHPVAPWPYLSWSLVSWKCCRAKITAGLELTGKARRLLRYMSFSQYSDTCQGAQGRGTLHLTPYAPLLIRSCASRSHQSHCDYPGSAPPPPRGSFSHCTNALSSSYVLNLQLPSLPSLPFISTPYCSFYSSSVPIFNDTSLHYR